MSDVTDNDPGLFEVMRSGAGCTSAARHYLVTPCGQPCGVPSGFGTDIKH